MLRLFQSFFIKECFQIEEHISCNTYLDKPSRFVKYSSTWKRALFFLGLLERTKISSIRTTCLGKERLFERVSLASNRELLRGIADRISATFHTYESTPSNRQQSEGLVDCNRVKVNLEQSSSRRKGIVPRNLKRGENK